RFLNLDGGGIRGLSSLIILKHLMKSVDPQNPPKPCDYFQLIGGTSTGGLIAIMLGRLRMDVSECIEKYLQLSSAAFTPKRHNIDLVKRGKDLWRLSGKYRSDSLVSEFKAAAKEIDGDEDATLFDTNADTGCKVFVCTLSKTLNAQVLLRSYKTDTSIDGLSTSGVKIWEAARATSAAPTFFDPIRIGNQDFVDGATGRNNPVESVLAEASEIWGPDAKDRIECLVSIGTGKSEFRDFGDNLAELKRTLVALATETEQTEQRIYRNQENLGVGGRYFRFNVDRGLEGVVLDDCEKQGTIISATEAYLETERVKETTTKFTRVKAPRFSKRCYPRYSHNQKVCLHLPMPMVGGNRVSD
ncbi:acyl transferase/acyl hydrolase/lysophospholipase, partial [Bombardia bombarda]